MKSSKILQFVLVLSLLSSAWADGLKVYLPREVTINQPVVRLGDIGVVRGPADLVKEAESISMGRFSVPGQQIVVSRQMITSRLASNQIRADVQFTGAAEITVKQDQDIIGAEKLVEVAEKYLRSKLRADMTAELNVSSKGQNIVLSRGSKDIKIKPQMERTDSQSRVNVKLTVTSGKEILDTRTLSFNIQYLVPTAVAVRNISQGEMISNENIEIRSSASRTPATADWNAPYGRIARNRIALGSEIKEIMLTDIQPEIMIRRNESVLLKYENGGMVLTANARALENGRINDVIKVRNSDSQRIVIARIQPDGSLEPVF